MALRVVNSRALLGAAAALAVAALAVAARAEGLESVELPAPRMEGGKPLMEALKERKTMRAFSEKPLPPQALSDLLWAAFGVNRPDGRRTAPSAVNWQEIDLYVALPEGLFLYEAKENRLKGVLATDIRASCGRQAFAGRAPVVLIYVADRSRMGGAAEKDKDFYTAVDTGFISQNVYLFCASEGLATVVLGLVDRAALAGTMGLGPDQSVILTQPVGYPAGAPD